MIFFFFFLMCVWIARFYILFSSKQYQVDGWFKVAVNLVSVH